MTVDTSRRILRWTSLEDGQKSTTGPGGMGFRDTESQGSKEVDLSSGLYTLGFSVECKYREGKKGHFFTERRNVRLSQQLSRVYE